MTALKGPAPVGVQGAPRLGAVPGVGGKFVRRLASLPTLRPSRSLGHRQVATSTTLPSNPTVQDPIQLDENSPNGQGPTFDWDKAWYPVQYVRNLDVDRPNRIELLGRWFVVWKGLSGSWNVMDDQCPHRLVPLSEGRIENDGNLLCAYHAWRFDETGKCVKIPQADSAKAEESACKSKQSRVVKYPSKVVGGHLFVWPDSSETRFLDSEMTPIPMRGSIAKLMDELEAEGTPLGYTREMPYSYDVLVENLIDPAHIEISHHGALPHFSRYNAGPLNMGAIDHEEHDYRNDILTTKSSLWGMEFCLSFTPPCLIDQWADSMVEIHVVPVAPGRSRLFFAQETTADELRKWPLKLFPWLNHLMYHNIFDGDNVFLNIQDRNMRSVAAAKGTDKDGGAVGSWRNFFLATSADTAVSSFRQWFDTQGGGGPSFPGGQRIDGRELSKEELLDRFKQHTKDCKACQDGMKMIDTLAALARVTLAVCFGGLCTMLGVHGIQGILSSTATTVGSLGLLVTLALAEAGRRFLANFRQQFFFVNFSHADMN